MALEIPQPPAESTQILEEGLRRLPGEGRPAGSMMALEGGAPPSITHPQQVFAMGLDDLATGAGLETARGVGWRYLVTRQPALGGAAMAAAEVNQLGGQHRFSQLHSGWISEETRRTIDAAQALPQVASGSYELRALRIPALLVDAIWLKDKAGSNDLVLPIRSNVKTLTGGAVYQAADFLDRLRAAAARKGEFDDRPQRP